MRAVVTGAAGFIGWHLTRCLLAKGHEVLATDLPDRVALVSQLQAHPRTRFGADIRSLADCYELAEAATEFRATHLFHLAAIASPRVAEVQPDLAWATNVQGTFNVLHAARIAGIQRVVFFSSAHVYGISPKYFPTDETHPLALHDTYTVTKIMGEDLCRRFYENHRISYVNLRLFNAYGEGQSPVYFIGAKIEQAKTKKVTLLGAKTTKDWVHVSDVVEAAIRAMESGYVGELNVGTGAETNLETIARTIAEMTGSSLTVEEDLAEPTRMCCDTRRMRATLDWLPQVRFADGLKALIAGSK